VGTERARHAFSRRQLLASLGWAGAAALAAPATAWARGPANARLVARAAAAPAAGSDLGAVDHTVFLDPKSDTLGIAGPLGLGVRVPLPVGAVETAVDRDARTVLGSGHPRPVTTRSSDNRLAEPAVRH
jgi:hypothetical protein